MYQHLSSSPFGPERIAAKKRAKKVAVPRPPKSKPALKPKPAPKPTPKKHTQTKATKPRTDHAAWLARLEELIGRAVSSGKESHWRNAWDHHGKITNTTPSSGRRPVDGASEYPYAKWKLGHIVARGGKVPAALKKHLKDLDDRRESQRRQGAAQKATQQKAKKRTAKDKLWPDKWYSGAWWPKVPPHRMPGAEKFTHIIRSPDDPEPLSRERRQAAGVGTESWKKAGQGTAAWKKQIMSVLKKSKKPITFNAIVVLATNGKFTADIVAGEDADAALWELVAEGKIEHTAQAPILFRVRK